MTFSIIIPAHNEEASISQTIRALEASVLPGYEIVVVDDHSSDNTAQVVKGLISEFGNINLVSNTDKPGFANALKAGFKNAKSEFVLPVMADLCDDPNSVNLMYEKAKEGFDIVCGSRYMRGGRKIGRPSLKSFSSRFVGKSLHALIGIPTHDISNSFKLYRRRILDDIKIESDGFDISVEIPLRAFFQGYKITELATTWTDRETGKSKFKVFKQTPGYLRLYLWALGKRIKTI